MDSVSKEFGEEFEGGGPESIGFSRLPHTGTRATRIVATVGPATASEAILRQMITAGVDVFRFNMSHGTYAEHEERMAALRRAASRLGVPVGVLVDLQGPKLRTAQNEADERIPLRRGETVRLEFQTGRGDARSGEGRIVIENPALAGALDAGDLVLLDDGLMRLRIESASGASAVARVLRGGLLKERAGVNIPGQIQGLAVPTRKDEKDAAFAVKQKADMVALSFVQSASEVRKAKRLLARLAGPDAAPPYLIAKLEKPAALEDLDGIFDSVEAVMVARGDLGVELPLEKVPLWQKEILRRARARGVFTITATQMLESMIRSAVPTRAEISDAANAILDGSDALMLSAESAIGAYPVESVRVLARVAREADRFWIERRVTDLDADPARWTWRAEEERRAEISLSVDPIEAVAHAAVEMAMRAHARYLIVFTRTGRTVRFLARRRPSVPILALTPSEETRRRLTLAWHTRSLLQSRARSADEMMRRALQQLQEQRWVRRGDVLVLAAGSGHASEASHLLRLVRVGESG